MGQIVRKTGETDIPRAKLVFTRTIETIVGEREIQLFWGNFTDLITEDSCVLISSTTYAERHGEAPTGMAWRSLKNFYDISEKLPFERILQAEPESAVWPLSSSLEGAWSQLDISNRPYIDSALIPKKDDSTALTPRRLFCLHSLPFNERSPANEEDYKYALGACLAAIRAQEAADLILHNVKQPYQELVMTDLAGRQTEKPHELLKSLMDEVEDWFIISPRIKTIKICFWSLKTQRELESRLSKEGESARANANGLADVILRQDLLSLLNEVTIPSDELQTGSTTLLIKEFRDVLVICSEEQSLSPEVTTALSNLYVILGRSNPTVLEIGSAAGRLAEGLVNHLYETLYGKRPSTFHNGIEDLAIKSPTVARFSDLRIANWYKSYLHTLRILRNNCAHSQEEQKNQYPSRLEPADTWILIVNLRRVLELHMKLLNGFNR